MKIVVCIPARYGSTRFTGKVLAKDTGKFLIQHTYEQACRAKLPHKVIIAADDQRIADAAKSFGAECILTSPDHKSGTDRIAEAVKNIDVDIVVNLQADEPEIDPDNVDYLAQLLIDNPDYPMATLAAPFQTADLESLSPGLTREMVGQAMYFIHADGQRFRGARAVFETMKRLPGLWGPVGAILSLPLLSWLAEPFYRLFARHRGQISQVLGLDHCKV